MKRKIKVKSYVREGYKVEGPINVKAHQREIENKKASSGSSKPMLNLKDIPKKRFYSKDSPYSNFVEPYEGKDRIVYIQSIGSENVYYKDKLGNKYYTKPGYIPGTEQNKDYSKKNNGLGLPVNEKFIVEAKWSKDSEMLKYLAIAQEDKPKEKIKIPFYNILYKDKNNRYSVNMIDYLRNQKEGKDYTVIKKIEIGIWDGENLESIDYQQEKFTKSNFILYEIKRIREKEIADKKKIEEEKNKLKSFDEVRQRKVDKFLEKKIRWSEGVYSYKDFVDKFVKSIQIALVPSVKWNRTKYNRMYDSEQKEYEKKLETKIPEYRLYASNQNSFYEVPKTVYQYALSKSIPER